MSQLLELLRISYYELAGYQKNCKDLGAVKNHDLFDLHVASGSRAHLQGAVQTAKNSERIRPDPPRISAFSALPLLEVPCWTFVYMAASLNPWPLPLAALGALAARHSQSIAWVQRKTCVS